MMSSNKSIHFDIDRLNPQFIGISDRYSKKKKQRQQIEKRKSSIENSYNHLEKMNQNMDSNLTRKKIELNYLRNVRERYMEDLRHKMQQEDLNKKKLEELRNRSDNARKTHWRNLEGAKDKIQRQKKNAHDSVCTELQKIKKHKREKKEELQEFFRFRQKEHEEEKLLGRSQINKFYRKKNKMLLTSYRQMIRDQDLKKKKSMEKINLLETQTLTMRRKMEKKQQLLNTLEDEIQKFKMTSFDLKNLTFEDDHNISRISGISKISNIRNHESSLESTAKRSHKKRKHKNKSSRTFMLTENSKNSQINLIKYQKQKTCQQQQLKQTIQEEAEKLKQQEH